MQGLDAFRELVRNRRCRFERHSPAGLGARAAAIEAKPARRIHELAMAVDEVGYPQHTVPQVDRGFPALAASQDLAEDRHAISPLVTLTASIVRSACGDIAKELLKMAESSGRPETPRG